MRVFLDINIIISTILSPNGAATVPLQSGSR